MDEKTVHARISSLLILLSLVLCPAVSAQDLMETLSGVKGLFYGIAAGIASMMLVVQALKWKTAEDPGEREAAKKGMVTIILGLIAVMIAGAAVDAMNGDTRPAGGDGGIVKMSTTSHVSSTRRPATTRTTTTTSTTTTVIAASGDLVPENLVKCVKSQGDLFSKSSGCPNCDAQRSVFYNDLAGNGKYWYDWMAPTPGPPTDRTCACSVYACWCKRTGEGIDGCRTFAELNIFWGCGLECKHGHVYYDCSGTGTVLC